MEIQWYWTITEHPIIGLNATYCKGLSLNLIKFKSPNPWTHVFLCLIDRYNWTNWWPTCHLQSGCTDNTVSIQSLRNTILLSDYFNYKRREECVRKKKDYFINPLLGEIKFTPLYSFTCLKYRHAQTGPIDMQLWGEMVGNWKQEKYYTGTLCCLFEIYAKDMLNLKPLKFTCFFDSTEITEKHHPCVVNDFHYGVSLCLVTVITSAAALVLQHSSTEAFLKIKCHWHN